MKRLWFIEGCDGVGKTTVVRELSNRSNHAIAGVVDRGPLSRVVWAMREGNYRERSDWFDWLKEAKDHIGVIILTARWEKVAPRLAAEAANPKFRGVRWDRASWDLCQYQYGRVLVDLDLPHGTFVTADHSLDRVLSDCAYTMGYNPNLLNNPAKYPVGQRETLDDGQGKA